MKHREEDERGGKEKGNMEGNYPCVRMHTYTHTLLKSQLRTFSIASNAACPSKIMPKMMESPLSNAGWGPRVISNWESMASCELKMKRDE